jgi:SAM-dependent methyltransferase
MNPFENWTDWSRTPLGLRLLSEEQAWLDSTLQDVFGYNALQIGPAPLDALRQSRMTRRLRAVWTGEAERPIQTEVNGISEDCPPQACRHMAQVVLDIDELPLQTQSLDLLVLAHALELAPDPRQLLREAERVLIPEGKLVIMGFNPVSLWRLRRRCRSVNRFPPAGHQWIGLPRLKDWLALLNFDLGAGAASAYGAYMPPLDSDQWLSRLAWMHPAGARWWPMAGGVYFMMAVKRVQGAKMIGAAWRQHAPARRAATSAASVRVRELAGGHQAPGRPVMEHERAGD